jgi:FkbM family methyltransferase
MLKKIFKENSHNPILKVLAGIGRSLNRLYENRNHNPYSNGEVTILRKISKFKPDVIFDGGANVGNYAKLINLYCPAASVYCFEPVKETFNKLQNNCSSNKKNILVNKGLYNENCFKLINVFPSDEHASLYDINNAKDSSTATIEIELIKGDDYVLEQKIESIFLLKLDLEGAEYDAIQGFEKIIKNNSVKAIQFEYGYINIVSKHLLIDYYKLLESYGYLIGKVFPKTVEFRNYDYKYEDFIGPNFIAVHKNEFDLIRLLSNK